MRPAGEKSSRRSKTEQQQHNLERQLVKFHHAQGEGPKTMD